MRCVCLCDDRFGPRLRVAGQTYHPDCFTCTACRKPFPTNKFSLKDGVPYHAECLPKAPVVPCTQCGVDIGWVPSRHASRAVAVVTLRLMMNCALLAALLI